MLSFFVIQDVHNTYFNISVLEKKILKKMGTNLKVAAEGQI